jgi:hypothetical protein
MHSSIRQERTILRAKPRRSIEVRALIFTGSFTPSTGGGEEEGEREEQEVREG